MPKSLLAFAAIPLALSVAACSGTTDRTVSTAGTSTTAGMSSSVCIAIAQLEDNATDFQVFVNAETAEVAYAALDRMTERTRAAVDDLTAIDGPAASEARRLAQVERGLLPILDQFRDASDQAGWTAARDSYASWYDQSVGTITDVVPRLGQLGIGCAG